jgi:hypothetical protein
MAKLHQQLMAELHQYLNRCCCLLPLPLGKPKPKKRASVLKLTKFARLRRESAARERRDSALHPPPL